ncbi:PREDICTED: complement C3, partial [Sturnus vulgaris]|uniref:complement C3 n=1 Tax=Sturnus vulgaris TaxID=9172 RepID=UPI00071A556A
PAKLLPPAQGKQFVTVTARVAEVTLQKVLLVALQSGHIFVQTDKPIYTPGATGERTWTHLDTPGDSWGHTWDTPGDSWAHLGTRGDIMGTPRYLYGKSLEGTAFVLFGVMVDDEKKSIPQSLRRVQVQDGDAEAVLSMAHLRERFPNSQELVGHSLYVTVTVITESGSDMVEAQHGGIQIVTSPYSIHFTHTPKYFKPGMPFDLTVYVTNPDQSPAPRVTVQADGFQGSVSTQRDGTARLVLNMPANKDSVPITVRTAQAGLPRERQASRQMTAQAYRSQGGSGNFLHLAVAATELQPGDNLAVNFHLKTSSNDVRNSVPFFTYLIMSKGRIVRAGRQRHEAGQSLVTMTLPVTPELIPSFRVVAYYHVLPGEIVADSVWVDVKDTCMGTLVVKGATEGDNRVHEPGTPMRLRIEGDHKAFVGLVAVDKGVFVLSKKNKLTQSRVWDTVERSDIGCTPGSGRDNIGVFADAGLSLTTNVQITTPQRSCRDTCESLSPPAAEYSDKLERKCCEDGMRDNPMGHSCDKRSEYIQEGDACVRAFLDCCRYIKAKRDQQNVSPSTGLARSKCWLTGEGHPLTPLVTPVLSRVSTKTLPVYLKDSITTWEVLAVSLSPSKGLCVADPYEITVMKEFFIDLRLPYAVVRNEQVEIRAILYNYWLHDITVRVELLHNPDLCSPSTAKQRFQQVLRLKAESSRSVSFVIVPLKLGLLDIEVKAAVRNQYVGDGVKKKLRVVPEGLRLEKTVKIVELDPQNKGINGVQEERVKAADLSDIVPDTESETKVSIQGNPVSIIVEKAIDGAKLKHLIVTPSGCGEQNMIALTPTVIAVHYLDKTLQWENFGIDRRAQAIELIRKGVEPRASPTFSSGLCPPQPEGLRLEKTVKIVELDPQNKGINGVQEERVKAADLSDIVPDTESETKVSIQGNPVSIIVEKAIDGAKLKHLIVTPSGCGEQNMIALTPTVIAVHYLDKTLQWENFGIDRRAQAIELIRKGYTQQLAFRKPDSSYAAFLSRPSSTWLTAYVVKVFAMAQKLVDIEHREICGPIKWLVLNRQKPDGVFQEDGPVIHKEMVGGYEGAEPEVSLTAFVLIALHEARDTCKDHVNSLDGSIEKAAGFLIRRYEQLARPYTVALASYALALTGKLKSEKILMRFSKGEMGENLGPPHECPQALVTPLSPQATILVFQALAQYQVAAKAQQQLELDVSVLLPRRASPVKYRIENSNALVARSTETKINEDFTVKAEGVGKGTMTVVTVYHAKVPEKDNKCDKFDLSVNVEEVDTGKEEEDVIRSVKITICTRYLDTVD